MTAERLRARVVKLRRTPSLLIVQKLLRQVPFRPVDIGKLCFLRLDGVPEIPRSRLRGPGVVRRGSDGDLNQLMRLRHQPDVFLDRFAAGDHCVVAEVGGRIVGYEWFCARSVHQEGSWGYRIDIPDGFIYAYDAFIDPAYRNAGIWVRFKAYLAELMTASRKRGVLTFVDYGNWASLGTHLRFGFRAEATVLAMKVFGRMITVNLDSM
jgi:GNAT superfamily N-acetyltransferase